MRSIILRGLTAVSALSLVFALSACSDDAQSAQSGAGQSGTSSSAQSGVDSTTGLATDIPEVDRSGEGNFPEVSFDGDVPTLSAGSGEEPDQVLVKTLKEGDGDPIEDGAAVLTDYLGTLWDGTVFDSSYASGQPAAFLLNQVISGWHYGLIGARVGDTVEIVIPSQYGYGSQELSESLPANSTLVFVVTIHQMLDPTDLSALSGATATNNALPEGIEVGGDLGSEPTLAFSGSNTFTDSTKVVLAEGSGKTITDQDSPLVYVVGGSYPENDSVYSAWTSGAQLVTVGSTTDFIDLKVGSRVLMIYPGISSTTDSSETTTTPATVLVVDIIGALSPSSVDE